MITTYCLECWNIGTTPQTTCLRCGRARPTERKSLLGDFGILCIECGPMEGRCNGCLKVTNG